MRASDRYVSVHLPTPAETDGAVGALRSLFAGAPDQLWATGTDFNSALWDAALLDPAREILGRSGKGLRARTLQRSWELAGGHPDGPPELLMLMIELIHVGSLIIDDIEDDSPRRRGGPALHRTWGVPVALNVGNWLYFAALAVLARTPLDPSTRLAAYEDVSRSLMHCHQGQALDLSVRVSSLSRHEVGSVVATSTRLKTGSLVRLASVLGARAAGAEQAVVQATGAFGEDVGVALQMLDDWSGISVSSRREKGLEDLLLERLTWPWAWLADETDDDGWQGGLVLLKALPSDGSPEELRSHLRERLGAVAPCRIRDQLDRAASGLEEGFGDSPAYQAARTDLAELERAFG